MAGSSAQEAIVLSSSDAEEVVADDDEDSWSEGGDAPHSSESDDDPLFPPVEPAQGSEDDETSSEGGGDEGSVEGEMKSPDPPAPSETPQHQPRMPNIPQRQSYTMNSTAASLPIPVNVPVPAAFSRAGLHDSAHFNQWLRHLSDARVPAPPYSEEISTLRSTTGVQLDVSLRREARNLNTWRSLLAATESEILELDRLQWILARMSTNPVLRAAASVQGADLTLPQTLLDRAAAPPPNVTYGIDDLSGSEDSHGGEASGAPTVTRSPPMRRMTADLRPVSFDETPVASPSSIAGPSRQRDPVPAPSRSPTRRSQLTSRVPTPGPSVNLSQRSHVRRRMDSQSPPPPPSRRARKKRRKHNESAE